MSTECVLNSLLPSTPFPAPFLNFEFVRGDKALTTHFRPFYKAQTTRRNKQTNKKKSTEFPPPLKFIFLLSKKKKTIVKIKLKISISRDRKRHYSIIYTIQADTKKKRLKAWLGAKASRHNFAQSIENKSVPAFRMLERVSCTHT